MRRIVKKEESEIVLSERGDWFHQGQPFENEKIIEFFHKAIRKDDSGVYYLYNQHGDKEEFVYFGVEDTAYFVSEVYFDQKQGIFRGKLNTMDDVVLDIKTLEEGSRGVTYCRVLDNDRARLTTHALMELSKFAVEEDDGIYLEVAGEKIRIGVL